MIQPKDIEEYFKDKKIIDDIGWTGEFHVSAKDILDCFIDLRHKEVQVIIAAMPDDEDLIADSKI